MNRDEIKGKVEQVQGKIKEEVGRATSNERLRDEGVANVFSRHTTASICIQEDEPLLLEDLLEFLKRAAPAEAHYRHNDFRVRTVHMHDDERPNGHAHCQQLVLGSSESVPVADGELLLGQWQRIFMIELDGPRTEREVIVQALGTAD